MSENISLVIDGTSIALVALGLAFALRNHWLGLLLGVLGLATISGTSVLRAYPNPTRASLENSIVSARAELGELGAKLSLLRAENTKLAGELAVAEMILKEKGKQLLQATADLEASKREQKNALLASVAWTRGLMAAGIATPLYAVERLPDGELIAGKVGDYFTIRFLDQAGTEVVFPKGQYVIPAYEAAIGIAAKRLVADLIQPIAAHKSVQVFLRGGADAEPMASHQGLDPEYGAISYRLRGADGKYGADLQIHSVKSHIQNEDLPLLRAAYVRRIITSALGPGELEILHKAPAKQVGDHERTVQLILYVEP